MVLFVVLVLVAAVLAQAGSDGGLAPAGDDDPGTTLEFSDSVTEIHFGW
ncbi:MAG: hypothetical protein ABR521_12630 [Gaiellaceae bacterium]